MKKIYVILFVLLVFAIFPAFAQNQEAEVFRQELPTSPDASNQRFGSFQEGIASWYGREFDGRPTASGEIFDSSQLTAAHPNLPFGTVLVVTNLHNNKKVTVRVNDRGPFVPARIIDISRAAAQQLDMIVTGTAPVTIETTNRIAMSTTAVGSLSQGSQLTQQVVTPPVFVSSPVVIQQSQIRLSPSVNIIPDKSYRLQIGSFKVARNAVDMFDRLKNAGFSPNYERYTDSGDIEYYRVVLANIRGTEMQAITQKLSAAGFIEAIIREEN